MSLPQLHPVPGNLPEPPYPPDIRAAGWHFQLDTTRIRSSDTWTLARPEIRPWLLILWMTAWEETPCGSLPADDGLVAAKIGIDAALFQAHRAVLMRGWKRHGDNRLYHNIVTEHVLEMVGRRKKSAEKMARWRNRLVTGNLPVSYPTGSGSGSGSGSGEVQERMVRVARAPTPPKPVKQGNRLPDDWRLPEEWKAWALEVRPDWTPQGVVRESITFRDYWTAKAGKDAVKMNWLATWRTWIRRTEKEPER